MKKQVVGVDEAGRGPLAGPVAVGVVILPRNFNWKLLTGVNDSKQLSELARDIIFEKTRLLQKQGKLKFKVSMVSARVIDKIGISQAVALGINRALKLLQINPKEVDIKLDGLLKAPEHYVHQETIIKGDAKEKVIGLASIMAKVTRDRYMAKLSVQPEYMAYDFAAHKGYGTKKHCATIKKFGLSDIHRTTFCTRLPK